MAVAALAESLDRMGLDIAEAVVERARSEIVRVPSVAQLYEVAREIRKEIEDRDHPALSAGEFLEAMPEDVRARVEAMHERWTEHEQVAEVEIETDWRRRKAALMAGSGGKSCNATGAIPVIRDGKRVCPDCGVEIQGRGG